ncbi:hypothetical protein ACH492_04355 [Streptomyces sp. NPDC019443]|uniref:hypothetical protein n=1 Tax=Streptomyces sp. NPDC019443 TaxID=3365061 RepID=UPI0037A95B95
MVVVVAQQQGAPKPTLLLAGSVQPTMRNRGAPGFVRGVGAVSDQVNCLLGTKSPSCSEERLSMKELTENTAFPGPGGP